MDRLRLLFRFNLLDEKPRARPSLLTFLRFNLRR